jgi:SAM-dependent methyltransferase
MASPIGYRKAMLGLLLLASMPFSRTARARMRHPSVYQLMGLKSPHSLYEYHTRVAASHVRGRVGRVLVAGCNTGRECAAFTDLGAAQVDGLDVLKDTGAGFRHARVSFLRSSAESIAVRDNVYDLVYSYATMEHVADIGAAFREFARVTRPGGIIYSLAAPLWNSRFGHHKTRIFAAHPWIHLRMNEDEITEFCERNGIVDPSGVHDIAHHVRYMMNPQFFNKIPAARYLDVCRDLPRVRVLMNALNLEPDRLLDSIVFEELQQKGYTRQELLALGHTFVGRKLAPE